MDPNSSEATQQQLDLAREQGEAYGRALACMIGELARDGGQQEAGHYRIGYAIEEAEGMYEWTDGELVWRDPEGENVHGEVAVRDAADGRFVPGVKDFATFVDPDGNEVGTLSARCAVSRSRWHRNRCRNHPEAALFRL